MPGHIYYAHLLCLRRTTARSGQLAHMTTSILMTITNVGVEITGGATTNCNHKYIVVSTCLKQAIGFQSCKVFAA